MKRLILSLMAGILALALIPADAVATDAPPRSDEEIIQQKINDLYNWSGGGFSKSTLRAKLSYKASAQGMLLRPFVEKVAAEAYKSIPFSKFCYKNNKADLSYSKKLKRARHPGDVFISTAGFGWFGHAGVYKSTTQIIHAPGKGKKSRVNVALKTKVGCGTVMEAPWKAKQRASAAKYANKNLIGRSYNTYSFWWNKYSKGSVNCSQLVWLSYKIGSKKDLDNNGGWAVYPWDLYHSKMVYKVIR